MRAVPISSNHLESLNGVGVPDAVIQDLWPIFLDPREWFRTSVETIVQSTCHGNSYGMLLLAEPLAGALPLAVDEDMMVEARDGELARS